MKPQMFVTFTLVLGVLCLPRAVGSIMLAYEKDYNITNFVEDSDLIVYGWVVEKEFVCRQPNGCTTEITIDVRETIKGKPNAGADRVKLTIEGGECNGLIVWVEDTAEFEWGEQVILFLEQSTRPGRGGYDVFWGGLGKRPVADTHVAIYYTLENDVKKEIYLPVDVVIEIAKAAAKNPEAARRLEEKIKAHIPVFEQFADQLKHEAQAIQAADPPPTTAEKAIELSNTITGLDSLAGVRITAAALTLPEDDDTPILSIKKRLLDSKDLWKVSYQVDALRHQNTVNPHIKGFDVYFDIARAKVLKIVSRDAEGLPHQYQKGIEVSNQQIHSSFSQNLYIEWRLPAVTPAYTLGDFLTGKGKIYRHYECYYIFPFNSERPKWLIIAYGGEPSIEAMGNPAKAGTPRKRRTLADGYFRTLEIGFVDAMSGEWVPSSYTTGDNDDTFR